MDFGICECLRRQYSVLGYDDSSHHDAGQRAGHSINTTARALSIGTDIGGSATPIGASANVVGTAVAMKNGYPIGWKKYCKYNVPATIIVLTISTVVIILRYVVLGG